ncbi:MAG: hypothetical protein Q9193_003509 [Seirophora villosa]
MSPSNHNVGDDGRWRASKSVAGFECTKKRMFRPKLAVSEASGGSMMSDTGKTEGGNNRLTVKDQKETDAATETKIVKIGHDAGTDDESLERSGVESGAFGEFDGHSKHVAK